MSVTAELCIFFIRLYIHCLLPFTEALLRQQFKNARNYNPGIALLNTGHQCTCYDLLIGRIPLRIRALCPCYV